MRFIIFLFSIFLSTQPIAADDQGEINPFRAKAAIITGSSSGLGAELAKIAADKKMKLVLVDIDLEPSEKFAESVRQQGGKAIALEVDLAQAGQRGQIIDKAMAEYGRIDYLFNNAGYLYLATLEETDLMQAQHEFEVNYWAYVDLASRVVPIMREQGGGTIVNIGSQLGHMAPPPGMGHYAATKHALTAISQSAAAELAPDNIRVYLASPGGMRTNVMKNARGPRAPKNITGDYSKIEHPRVAAKDIFEKIQGDDVIFYPGAAGRAVSGQAPEN